MRIVHVSTNDIEGGAARATFRLHKGLRELGHESVMYVAARRSDEASVIQFQPARDLFPRLKRFMRQREIAREFSAYESTRPPDCELFSDDRSRFDAEVTDSLPPCDVVNLHWIANFVDYQALFSAIPDGLPIVWRLADMNAFTGGCHFDDGCGRFREACGICPQLGSHRADDLSRQVWRRKHEAFRRRRTTGLHIVTLCQWMTDQVKQSSLLNRFPITVIPNGLDLAQFAPRDKRLAREVLSVPPDACVLLFVADGATNRRKGFSLLADALKSLDMPEELYVLSVGHGQPTLDGGVRHLHLGPVDYRWLSLVYSAADVFVIPSLQDNLPNTVLEAMACGTPVVGFAVGGIPEMVRHGSTGLLVPPADVAALRRTINEMLLNRSRLEEMSHMARRVAVSEYSLDRQARRYNDLYQSLLPLPSPVTGDAHPVNRVVPAVASSD